MSNFLATVKGAGVLDKHVCGVCWKWGGTTAEVDYSSCGRMSTDQNHKELGDRCGAAGLLLCFLDSYPGLLCPKCASEHTLYILLND